MYWCFNENTLARGRHLEKMVQYLLIWCSQQMYRIDVLRRMGINDMSFKSYGPDRTFKLYSHISQHLYQDVCGKLSILNLVYKKNFYYNPYLPLFVCTNQPWNGLNTLSPRNSQSPVPMSCCLSSPRSSTAGCWTWSHSPHINWRVIPSLPSTLLWRVSCSWIFHSFLQIRL